MMRIFQHSVVIVFLYALREGLADDCPEAKCADPPPKVEDGLLMMEIYYDNDALNSEDQSNTHLVQAGCDALDYFGDEFDVTFTVGASTYIDEKNELVCRYDCHQDRLEACAYLYVESFKDFVCCNNRGGDAYTCAQNQGISREDMDRCVEEKESDQVLLDNAEIRRIDNILDCFLPTATFNLVLDRCMRLDDSDYLKREICGLFLEAEIFLSQC